MALKYQRTGSNGAPEMLKNRFSYFLEVFRVALCFKMCPKIGKNMRGVMSSGETSVAPLGTRSQGLLVCAWCGSEGLNLIIHVFD